MAAYVAKTDVSAKCGHATIFSRGATRLEVAFVGSLRLDRIYPRCWRTRPEPGTRSAASGHSTDGGIPGTPMLYKLARANSIV